MPRLPPCPKCGSDGGVYQNVRLYGWGQQYFDTEGVYAEFIIDEGLQHSSPQRLRCEDCLGIRRDIVMDEGHVVPKKEASGA